MNLLKRFLKFIFLSLGYRIERIDRKRNDEFLINSDYNPVVAEIKSYVDSRLNHHHRQTAVPISKDSLIFTHLLDGGRILLDPTDINITPHVIENGTWEPYMTNFLKRHLRPNDVCVDIGANIGITSICAKPFLYPTSGRPTETLIYCFEAVPSSFEVLKMNAHLNDFKWFSKLENMAVSNISGEIEFEHCLNMSAASGRKLSNVLKNIHEGEMNTIKVKAITLDDYFEPGTKIDLIKIDVEGFESDVVLGAQRVIKDNQKIVMVIEWTPAIAKENNISNHVTDAINFLESQDFKVYHIGERIWVKGSKRGMGHFEELPIDGEVEISYEKFRELTKNNFSGDLVFKKA